MWSAPAWSAPSRTPPARWTGGTAAGQAALAVDTLWHTLAEDPSYERMPTAPYEAVHPAARAARVRELARWNDEPVRRRDEVLGLIDRAVSRTIMHSVR
jgi:hypothetical protein